MAINYANLQSMAERLIRENGRDITIVRRSRTPANPSQPGRADDAATTSVIVKGVILFADLEQVDGVTIERDDKIAFVAAQGLTQQLEDFDYVLDGSDKLDIINKNVIEPGVVGSSRVLYVFQLRK